MLIKYFAKSFKFTVLISALLIVVHSPELRAEGPSTVGKKIDMVAFAPFSVWFPQLKNQIQNSKLDLAQSLPNYQYSNPDGSIQFVSERVDFDTHFQTSSVADAQGGLQLGLQLSAATILINNFELQAVINKDLGFGTATLKLDMHCDAIELGLKNVNPVTVQVSADKGQFNLSHLSWNLRNTAIATRLIGCREVAGFDQLMKDQIQQNLEQSFVLTSLQQIVNEKLNGVINERIAASLVTYIQKFKLNIEAKHEFDEQNNLWIYAGPSLTDVFTNDEIQKIKVSTKPALLIKKKSLETYATGALNDILKTNTISSKSLDGLSKLTCSRFLQFFVWPSLRSLNKCFEMRVQNQIQSLSITDLNTLALSLKMGSWAAGEGHQIAYFESGLSGKLADATAQMDSFEGQADPEFIKWSGKSKRISSSLIQTAVDALLKTSVQQLKENDVFKMIQKKTSLKALSSETLLVEVNL